MAQNLPPRKHSRLASDLPVKVLFEELVASESTYLNNISEGGMSFNSMRALETGSLVNVRIPLNKPIFDFACRVVWCTKKGVEYTIGVEFIGSDAAFRQRLVTMVQDIDNYRLQVQEQGRHLTSQQATLEWISRFADQHGGEAPPAE